MNMQPEDVGIAARTTSIVDEMKKLEGPLLPILHEIQHELGYVPQEALPVIASGLNLSRAEVYGVASFYHDYRERPTGRHVLKVCRAESCQAMRGDEMADRLRDALGVDWHGTSKDGAVTLELVYCLGLCACSPSAMLDGEVFGRLDEERIGEIVAEVRQ